MLLSKDAIADAVEVLRGVDFYRPAHESIYEAILDLYGRGEPADAVTVADELTKRGYTSIIRKKVGPSWTPTASQMERYPSWKPVPPGPENPLGTHAMYLSWPAYIIHGTHDTRKIGRKSSDGCIGLFNDNIAQPSALRPSGSVASGSYSLTSPKLGREV